MLFQDMILALDSYWAAEGCVLQQPYDLEVGAGTFHPATFLRSIGPEPWRAAYVQPSRRPADGRYGDNPNRLQHYYQYQVVLKPSPANVQDLYLRSLEALGIDPLVHDIRFVEDNWQSPTLGAWGLGWEIWLNGMEITQFTYFQQAGGIDCRPVTAELTYGLERVAMYLQRVDSVYDLAWTDTVTYGDVYLQNEQEMSAYNFVHAAVDTLFDWFETCEAESRRLAEIELPIPAYEMVLKASHLFNLLDARGALSVTERQRYLLRVRGIARGAAQGWLARREQLGFPLLRGREPAPEPEPEPEPGVDPRGRRPAAESERCDLLVEIGTEELPPQSLRGLSEAFADEVREGLAKAGLAGREVEPFATARRLALIARGVPSTVPGRTRERRGPAVAAAFDPAGQPTRAALGFAGSCGVDVAELDRIETPKGTWLVHRVEEPPRPAADLVPGVIETALARLPIARRMRWGDGDAEFVRPVHWLVLLLGEEVVAATVLGIRSGRETRGHRFHHPEPIALAHPGEYREKLHRPGRVVASFGERRGLVDRLVAQTAAELGGRAVFDDGLLDEVTALVEWPVAVAGRFEERFLDLPRGVITATLQGHQRYFPVEDEGGRLRNSFVTISNVESGRPDAVRAGNERVVRPRLEDAAFFVRSDLEKPLAARRPDLEGVVFQEKLGSMAAKSDRVAVLVRHVGRAAGLDAAGVGAAVRAAELGKCDLVTAMVGEFPDLQGYMGACYARAAGEPDAVAVAIEEAYLPRFAGDAIPRTAAGRVLAVAERLDTVAGIFGVGLGPTGDRDPFALRRSALGVLRILVEAEIDADLEDLLRHAVEGYGDTLDAGADRLAAEVFEFVVERLRGWSEAPPDVFAAVHARRPVRPLDFVRRMKAVETFRALPEAASLAAANKRIANLLRQVEEIDPHARRRRCEVDPGLFAEPAEGGLAARVAEVAPGVEALLARGDHAGAMSTLAGLRESVDSFFDEVQVMSDDPAVRANRLALLARIGDLFLETADISRLQA